MSQDTVLCGRAYSSREGATILEFSEFFISYEWCLGGLGIPFPSQDTISVSGYHFRLRIPFPC